ncbi:MAG TPA: hypothetical protein HA362_06590 [Nanoarchaeota archaeon]|nr:hypothetical protein [Nanoarchaeota archaeon]
MATSKKLIKGKKKWFVILSPPEFKEQIIGETSAYEPEQVIGRTVSMNLGYLVPEARRQNAIATFKVKSVQGLNASTQLVRYEVAPMLIKRLVKKERDKADDSFVAETKDGVKFKLKPFLVTRGFAHNSLLTALRMKARQILSDDLKKKTYSEAVVTLASGELQKLMKTELKKILPLAVAEIRVVELVK